MAQGSLQQNVNLKKVGGTATDTGFGNSSGGTQRVVLASNQTVPVSASTALSVKRVDDTGNTISVTALGLYGTIDCDDGVNTVFITVSGTYTGKLYIEGTGTGAAYYVIPNGMQNVATGKFVTYIDGEVGTYRVNTAGIATLRLTAKTPITGTATVIMRGSTAVKNVGIDTEVTLNPASVGTIQKNDVGGEQMVFDKTSNQVLDNILLQLKEMNYKNPGSVRELDQRGREIVAVTASPENQDSVVTTISNSTTETAILQLGDPNAFVDIIAIWAVNTSASTVCKIELRDSLGGKLRGVIQTVGGQSTNDLPLGGMLLTQKVRGGAWTAKCGTATTDIIITVLYAIRK